MTNNTPIIEIGSGFDYSDLSNNPPVIMDSQGITIEETNLDGGLGSIDSVSYFNTGNTEGVKYHLTSGYYAYLYFNNGQPSYLFIMSD